MTSGRQREVSMPRLSDGLAITAACIFIFLAAYRIELPGLYMNDLDFVNAAQGAPDNTMIYMRLGPVPLLVFPYIGALKAWIYAPIFRLFGVSALTIRLPVILIAAVTLLIFYRAMRRNLGAIWAAIVVWIMAVDPANLFPSRLDWGPTVLMHLFQAAILALWFSYRDKPQLWKPALIFVCFGLGFFDKFNFIWLVSAFAIGICLCYPDSLKNLWVSLPRFARWIAVFLVLIAVCATLSVLLPLLRFAFLARSLYTQLAWKNLRRLAALLLGVAAVFVFAVNVHNTTVYLSHFRTNSHYNPRWSPEIYSLSDYISEHGFEAKSVICVDWGLHNQLHALAPKKLRRRMHDFWPAFKELGNKNWEKQSAVVNHIFPKGKSLVLTFAASKETFPETRRNFLDSLSTHPELKSHLVKEFRFAREKIYELYEIFRPPDGASQIRHAAPTATAHANRFAANSDGLDCHRMSSGTQ